MLYIKPIEAYLTRETNLLLSMDPYCVIIFNNKQYKTNPHYSGGNRPKWSQTFSFEVSTLDKIKVETWSRSVISNDSKIGAGELDLRKLRLVPGTAMQEYVELFYEGKSAGKMLLELAFTIVKKKGIFDEKVRSSLPDLKELSGIVEREMEKERVKDKSKKKEREEKEKEKEEKEKNGFLFSFGRPPQQENTQQQQQQQPQQKAQQQNNPPKNIQNQTPNQNPQQKIPPQQQPPSFQQIPSQLSQQPSHLQQPQPQPLYKPQNPPPKPQLPQQLKPNTPQQNNLIKPTNLMPGGLPHNRPNLQRPVSPITNTPKFAPTLQKYNPPSLPQQHSTPHIPSNPTIQLQQQDHKNRGAYYTQNQKVGRQNKQMTTSDKVEKVGLGKTPPKSILSPTKGKRDKSNKKVTFES